MTDHVEQQSPVGTDGPHIHDLAAEDLRTWWFAAGAELVAEDLAGRKAIGVARYGQPLQAHNGRDALRDAYEEALDLVVYLRQAQVEGGLEDSREDRDVGSAYVFALRIACLLARRTAAASWRTTGKGES